MLTVKPGESPAAGALAPGKPCPPTLLMASQQQQRQIFKPTINVVQLFIALAFSLYRGICPKVFKEFLQPQQPENTNLLLATIMLVAMQQQREENCKTL